jgi:hypothetical protein
VLRAGGDHGGLEQDALKQHVVVGHVLEGLGPGGLGDLQGAVNVVVAVQQDLGLHNGDLRQGGSR